MAPTNNSPGMVRHPMKEVVPIAILTVGAILVSLPLLWMFSTSLRPSSESYKLPPQWLPTQFHFENYGALFGSSVPFFTLFLNSLKITAAVTGGQLVFCSMAGFAFARLRFPARHLLFILLLASRTRPWSITASPVAHSVCLSSSGFMISCAGRRSKSWAKS